MRTCSISARAFAIALAACTAAPAAFAHTAYACGFCHNDKKASVYDAELLARAKANGFTVVYAEFGDSAGKLAPIPDSPQSRDDIRRAVKAASGAHGEDIRVVTSPSAALCFAYNPAKGNVQAVLARISVRLGHGWRALQITD